MWAEAINGAEFLTTVRPALQGGSADELARVTRARWSPQQLCELLADDGVDVRKTACLVLGLVGDERVMNCLAASLRDVDAMVAQMAEYALWSIWFRLGSPEAQGDFQRGMQALEHEKPDEAITWFGRAVTTDPSFAEAYNQCAIAHYMREEWDAAAVQCRKAMERVPMHFGAIAGLGHCFAQMGKLPQAAEMYRRALAIHPRMEGMAQALAGIDKCVGAQ
jgi:tetratricopeptide (TPR) repeat protein